VAYLAGLHPRHSAASQITQYIIVLDRLIAFKDLVQDGIVVEREFTQLGMYNYVNARVPKNRCGCP
jgi:hypothetical protein